MRLNLKCYEELNKKNHSNSLGRSLSFPLNHYLSTLRPFGRYSFPRLEGGGGHLIVRFCRVKNALFQRSYPLN